MPGEQKTIKCPFCKEGDITVLYFEREAVSKITRAAGNTKTITYMKDPRTEVLTEKCPNCGKTKKELEKRIKEGSKPSREEIIKYIRSWSADGY